MATAKAENVTVEDAVSLMRWWVSEGKVPTIRLRKKPRVKMRYFWEHALPTGGKIRIETQTAKDMLFTMSTFLGLETGPILIEQLRLPLRGNA